MKRIILSKPMIVGNNIDPKTMWDLAKNEGDWGPFKKHLIINLKANRGQLMQKGSGLEIIQADLNMLDSIDSFEKFIDLIFIGAGASPIFRGGSAMKTTSEIFVNQEFTNVTLRMLKQLRIDQFTRIYSKAILIGINRGILCLKEWHEMAQENHPLSYLSHQKRIWTRC